MVREASACAPPPSKESLMLLSVTFSIVTSGTPEIAQPARRAVEDLSSAAAPRWYPVIDRSLCSRCKQCLDFCLFGVYGLGESGAPQVENPDECKPGCPACARVCPRGAIMFPHYDAEPAIAGAEASRAEPPAPADHEDLDKLIEELESMEL